MSDETKGRVIRSPKKWMDDFDPSWGDVPNSLPEMTEDRIAAIQLDVMHFCAAKSDDDYARLVAELAAARKALITIQGLQAAWPRWSDQDLYETAAETARAALSAKGQTL